MRFIRTKNEKKYQKGEVIALVVWCVRESKYIYLMFWVTR
jgi:hypothetical protein